MKVFFYKILPGFIAGLIKLLYKSSTWVFIGQENVDPLIEQKKPVIVAFWHSQLLMMPMAWRWKLPFYMLLSKHKDGQFIGDIVERFNISSIAGSTNMGGARAFIQLKNTLKEGKSIGITPDGPKGPRHQASLGIIQLAKLTSTPIAPMTYATKSYKLAPSWDKLMIPLPFTKGVYLYDEPFYINPDHDMEEARLELEKRLNLLQQKAHDFFKES